MSQPDRAGCVDDHTTYAPMTDPSTWTEQEQADLVAALKNITEACSTMAKDVTAAFESLPVTPDR